jgi:hypothetical protein
MTRPGANALAYQEREKSFLTFSKELPFGIPDTKLVEDPAGGVILVGGRSLEILDTLFRLAHAEATEWRLMPQRMKIARRLHTAFMIPGIYVIKLFFFVADDKAK